MLLQFLWPGKFYKAILPFMPIICAFWIQVIISLPSATKYLNHVMTKYVGPTIPSTQTIFSVRRHVLRAVLRRTVGKWAQTTWQEIDDGQPHDDAVHAAVLGWRSAKQWCFYHQKWRGLLSRRVKTANLEYIGHLWTIGKRKIANIDIGRHFGLRFRMIQRDYIQRWLKIQHTTLKLRSASKSRGAFPRLSFYFSLSLSGFCGQFYTSSTTPPYLWRHGRDPTSEPRSFNCGKKCSSSVALDRCYRCESFWSRIGIGPNNLTKGDTVKFDGYTTVHII